jgi:outer membrane protein assembly factor BamD
MKKIFLLLTIVLLLSGCSLFETSHEMNQSSQELVAEGSSAFVAGDYRDAIKAYTDLRDWYPFSKYAPLAELKIADAHFALEEYEEAVFAYEEFEKMHPRNEAVPYVVYQVAMCWFNQIGKIGQDHTPAKNSLVQFNRLIEQYPGSEYSLKAAPNIKKCIDNISGHELYVANFYMKTKKYKAALGRYEYLVANYPDSKESIEALNKISECRRLANKD